MSIVKMLLGLLLAGLIGACGGSANVAGEEGENASQLPAGSWDEGDIGLLVPLGLTDRWEYIERGKIGQENPTTVLEKVLDIRTSANGTVSMVHSNFERQSASTEYRRKTSIGVSVVAALEAETEFGHPGTIGLLNFPIVVGSSYVAFDSRRNPSAYNLSGVSRHLEIRVDVLGKETIATPAGVFEDAVRIRSTLNSYAVLDPDELTATTVIEEWHFPRVGVVRRAELNLADMTYLNDYLLKSYWVRGRNSESVAPEVILNESGEDKGLPGPNDDQLFFSFNEDIDEWTVTKDNVYLEKPSGERVSSGVSLVGREGRINTSGVNHGMHTAVMTVGVQDRAGNPIARELRWPVLMDRSRLGVVAVTPGQNAEHVDVLTDIEVKFDKPLLQPIPGNAVEVFMLGGMFPQIITGLVTTVDKDRIRLANPRAWRPGTRYRIVVSQALQDRWLNSLSQDHVFEFSTGNSHLVPGGRIIRGAGSLSIAVGDLNSDGRDDLAELLVDHSDSGADDPQLLIRLQSEAGQFGVTAQSIPTLSSVDCRAESVQVGDLNGDEREDVLVDCESGYFTIHFQTTSGVLAAPRRFPATYDPLILGDPRIFDVNGDGRSDLIDRGLNGHMRVRLQSPVGDLEPILLIAIGAENGGDYVVHDFNRDGLPDIATVTYDTQYIGGGPAALNKKVVLMVQLVGGGFQLAQSFPIGDATRDVSLAAGDINRDGFEDLLVSYRVSTVTARQDWFVTYSGQSDGALGAPVTEASNDGTRGLALLDLTGDGRLDRVFADGLTIAAQKADGGYERPTFYGSFDSGSGRYPQIGDLNSDGHNDVITPLGSGEWIILEGRGRTNSMSVQALRNEIILSD